MTVLGEVLLNCFLPEPTINLFDYGKKALGKIYPIANSYGASVETTEYRNASKDTVCFYYMMMSTLFMILFLNFRLVDSVHINQDVHAVVTVLLDSVSTVKIL